MLVDALKAPPVLADAPQAPPRAAADAPPRAALILNTREKSDSVSWDELGENEKELALSALKAPTKSPGGAVDESADESAGCDDAKKRKEARRKLKAAARLAAWADICAGKPLKSWVARVCGRTGALSKYTPLLCRNNKQWCVGDCDDDCDGGAKCRRFEGCARRDSLARKRRMRVLFEKCRGVRRGRLFVFTLPPIAYQLWHLDGDFMKHLVDWRAAVVRGLGRVLNGVDAGVLAGVGAFDWYGDFDNCGVGCKDCKCAAMCRRCERCRRGVWRNGYLRRCYRATPELNMFKPHFNFFQPLAVGAWLKLTPEQMCKVSCMFDMSIKEWWGVDTKSYRDAKGAPLKVRKCGHQHFDWRLQLKKTRGAVRHALKYTSKPTLTIPPARMSSVVINDMHAQVEVAKWLIEYSGGGSKQHIFGSKAKCNVGECVDCEWCKVNGARDLRAVADRRPAGACEWCYKLGVVCKMRAPDVSERVPGDTDFDFALPQAASECHEVANGGRCSHVHSRRFADLHHEQRGALLCWYCAVRGSFANLPELAAVIAQSDVLCDKCRARDARGELTERSVLIARMREFGMHPRAAPPTSKNAPALRIVSRRGGAVERRFYD